MREIIVPLTFDDLPTKPPLTGRPKITEDIQQTAALLVGSDKITRRLVYVNPQGVLHSASPPVQGILNLQADGDTDTWQGSDIKTTEVLLRTYYDNAGYIRANVGAAATITTGYFLNSGEWVRWSLDNLRNLHLYFRIDDDRIDIVYTK